MFGKCEVLQQKGSALQFASFDRSSPIAVLTPLLYVVPASSLTMIYAPSLLLLLLASVHARVPDTDLDLAALHTNGIEALTV
jgi:hypothetical protein